MNPQGILDTSTVILLQRLADATRLPQAPTITAVTLAELSVGPLVAQTDTERALRRPLVRNGFRWPAEASLSTNN